MATSTPQMRVLAACIESRVPALLWGPPGIGKTATIEAHAAHWGMYCETIVGSYREPGDFLGMPHIVDGVVEYPPLSWLTKVNGAERALLFLDEFSTSPPSVQKAMLRILQERHVGEHRLNDSVSVIAAANPPDVAVDGWALDPPTANRFLHLTWESSSDEWLEGLASNFSAMPVHPLRDLTSPGTAAEQAAAAQKVTGFLAHRPDMREPGVPKGDDAAYGWASRRSWHNLARVMGRLDRTDDVAIRLTAIGLLGEGTANEFMAWLHTADLADPEAVLADPTIVDWSHERPDKLFALVSAVSGLAVLRGDEKSWTAGIEALIACAEASKADVAMAGMRSLMAAMPDGATVPRSARQAFSDLFQHTGAWSSAAA
ncbi:ATP-binding protein [Aeromicrobium sp. CTD01-1L150]|uniref:ATP-binding protein n=1 Tax=Aeromicrobium sp. CTD01-1L150 TaxID=3341830 RepID=UPI0035BEF6A6